MVCGPDEFVARAVEVLRTAGVDAQPRIVHSAGRPALAILDAADDQAVDLLIAGWRPRHTLGGLLEKFTGQKLTDATDRPVLLVP